MKFSIVISTLNRLQELKVTLSALEFQRHADFEVIIVNGPSTDKTDELLDTYRNRAKVLQCAEANLSISRNIGIAHASGDVIAFLDDDAVPEPDWLTQLEIGFLDERVAGVGGFIRDNTGVAFQARVTVCDNFGDAKDYPSLDSARVQHSPQSERFLSLTGCNSSFRAQALAEIGGFDEEYAYFLDETDVCRRLANAGYELKVVSSAQVHHKYAASHIRNEKRVPRSLYLPARSKAYFCAKFGAGHDLHAVFDRLFRYRSELSRDNKWLLENGLIGPQEHAALTADVDRGIVDGLRDAAALDRSHDWLASRWPEERPPLRRFPVRKARKDRIRLCMVSREFPPGLVGGIGRWTHTVAEGLAERGHEVSVISISSTGKPTIDFVNGVWVHRIVPTNHPNRRVPTLPDLPPPIRDHMYSVYDEFARIRALRGCDVLSFPVWDLEGLAIARSLAVPTVMSLHTTYALALPSKPDWITNSAYRRQHVDKLIAAERDALTSGLPLLANSRSILDDLERTYSVALDTKETTVVPHGVPDDSTKVSERRSDNRAEVNVLFVGRHETRKGIDILLDTLPQLLSEHATLKVNLVGDDSIVENGVNHRKRFLDLHGSAAWIDRVRFHGAVEEDELADHYASCDIFVAPSRYESFGLIFAEAAVFSKPSVAPDIGGVRDVVVDEQTGLLFEAGSVEGLARALSRLITDRELRSQLGKAARSRYEAEHTVEIMVSRLEEYFSRHMAAAQ